MDLKIIITGLGGQGVIFITRLIAQAATSLDHPVMISETHGMSQRGGSVVSHLKIGGNQAALIHHGTADILIGLNPDEAVRQLPLLQTEGIIIANTSSSLRPEIHPYLKKKNIQAFCLPGNEIALELGSPAVQNVVMVGFTAANPLFSLPIEKLTEALEVIATRGLEINQQALDLGFQKGKKMFSKVLAA